MTSFINIETFINSLSNNLQKEPLYKIYSNDKTQHLYMESYIPTPHTEENSVIGKYNVLGALHNNKRNQYIIEMYDTIKNNAIPTFVCSCMDYKLHKISYNRVCKHICFIICKFGKIFDKNYFDSNLKQLTRQDVELLIHKSERFINVDVTNINEVNKLITTEPDLSECFLIHRNDNTLFTDLGRHKYWDNNPDCPICYENIMCNNSAIICPTCTNVIHKQCMLIWLKQKKNCIYCRDTIWQNYKYI